MNLNKLNNQQDDIIQAKGYKVYFAGRNTPVCVDADTRSQAISKAKKQKKRGGEKVVSAKPMTAQENKTAQSGGWIRTRPNGQKVSGLAPGNSKGMGPKPKKYKG